jgi:ribosomal protein L30/L7E
MGMLQKVIRDGAANGAEKGMLQKVIHDGGL